ncbi:MAG: dipeptidyl-peptidase-4 [Verrucomicrobiales bacterium]|jgi:dipeptidyl-peptidase-4
MNSPSHIICVLLLLHTVTWAQGSKEDYERAANLRKQLSGKVYRNRVDPQWIEGSAQFWYTVDTAPKERTFVVIDPEKGTRWESTDRAELHKKLGISPSTDEKTSVRVLGRIRDSRSTGGSTEITFVNKLDRPITYFWIGDPKSPTAYGDVDPGKEAAQHTYAGHVWMVKDANERLLGVFEATQSPGTAVIDGTWKPNAQKKKEEKSVEPKSKSRSVPSPDGAWHIDIVEHNVRLTHRETQESYSLTTLGTPENSFTNQIFWSPDGTKLVVVQTEYAEKRVVHVVESSPEDQPQPRLQSFDYVKPGDALDHPRPRLFDVASRGELSISDALFPDPWSLSKYQWDEDSSTFTFLYNQRGHQVLRLLGVNAETGTAKTLIEEAPETFVCYSQKSFYQKHEPSSEILWMSERNGWNHLYLFDSKTGDLKNAITQGEWVIRDVERVDWEHRQVWFQAGGMDSDQDPYQLHHARINFDGTGLVRLTEADGTHRVTYSPDQRFLVNTYSRVDLPPVTELRRSADGALVMLLEVADIFQLREAGWKAPERFVAKGRDDETLIYGIIHRPTHFDPAKIYPVIEQIYAGPHAAHVPKAFSARSSEMAELGFIVVQIDGMGTSHRSKAFHDICWQDIGDAGFPDRIRWIKAAAKTRPWMDLSRVGIYGGSAGGQNAMRALIAHHDFYHVAVADCGCHDNRMDKIWWNEQWMGYPLGEHYAESSNVDQAHRMEGKLLLIVGELDKNVDPASTMQVVDALVQADKDFELLVMPGVGHGAAGSPYGRRRQSDFFVRHLLGVEPRQP